MGAIFDIKRSVDGKYVFNLKSANDQIILTSQGYETKEDAEAGVASVRQHAPLDDHYEEKTGSNGHPYFVLLAANKRVIGRSQMYSSREAMRKGIAAVKKNVRIAETVDNSTYVRMAGARGFNGAA